MWSFYRVKGQFNNERSLRFQFEAGSTDGTTSDLFVPLAYQQVQLPRLVCDNLTMKWRSFPMFPNLLKFDVENFAAPQRSSPDQMTPHRPGAVKAALQSEVPQHRINADAT